MVKNCIRHLPLLCFLALISACNTAIDWSHHISFRSYGKGMHLSRILPKESVKGALKANLHYISIGLDAMFFRNLPGLYGRPVVVGFEVKGLLPEGKVIQTVLGVVKSRGPDDFISFRNKPIINPFLYTGRAVSMTLYFRGLDPREEAYVRGKLAAAGDQLKHGIDPGDKLALYNGKFQFAQSIGTSGKAVWKYRFALHPTESLFRDKPEMLLTAARHVLLCTPPAQAPKVFRRLRPKHLMLLVRIQGNRLVWRKSGDPYQLTPYITLNIRRYRRYPKGETKVKKLVKLIENMIANKNYKFAEATLSRLGEAINEDRVITQNEKNLEQAWLDFREARIKLQVLNSLAESAERKKEIKTWRAYLKKMLKQVNRQVVYLGLIRSQFAKILYAYEAKKIKFLATRLRVTGERLARRIGEPIDKVTQVFVEFKQRLAKSAPIIRIVRDSDYGEQRLVKIPMPSEREMRVSSSPVWKKWWFWTLLTAAVGGGVATYFALRNPAGGTALPGTASPIGPKVP